MSICGLIAEYNPLHNGHVWQIQQIKKNLEPEVLVVVMSGNFVQRGDFAILNKWKRTQLALNAGVDLIIELPIYGAVQPADIFAEESLRILQQLQVDTLVFGSENPQLDYYKLAEQVQKVSLNSEQFTDFHNTYATQFNQNLQKQLGINITQPNQLLGLAYAQKCLKLNYPVRLVPLARKGQTAHNDVRFQGKYSSASAIRQSLFNKESSYQKAVPKCTQEALKKANLYSWKDFFKFLKYQLLTVSLSELGKIYQMNEGLEYKLRHEILVAQNFNDFLRRVKSKRYTYARLRRLCMYTLLNISVTQMQQMRQQRYLHVLGFNSTGQRHLHDIKKDLALPLITKVTQKLGNGDGLMEPTVMADRIFNLVNVPEQNFGRQPIKRK